MKKISIAALALAFALSAVACKKANKDQASKQTATTPPGTTVAPKTKPAGNPPPSKVTRVANKLAARHILFSYKGARRAMPTVTRTKEQARQAAMKAFADLKAGKDFVMLARTRSDCPSKRRGGFLGVFRPWQMDKVFSRATTDLKVGEHSGVVETPFGFHIIRREKVEEVRASHILYMYKGSMRAAASVTRSKEEARKAAESALAKIKGGAKLAAIAKQESDCPSKRRGGDLGKFGKGLMAPAFEKTAFNLKVGEVSGVVETPFGFHVIQRTN